MPAFADTLRDPARLAALADTGLVGAPPHGDFDRLTRLAARVAAAPIAALSLVDDSRQFILSHVGIPPALAAARELPVAASICAQVVAAGGPLELGDAAADARSSDSTFVTMLGVRGYAGFPLVTRGGHALGTLCVCDLRPRAWDAEVLAALGDLAAVAAAEVERCRQGAAGGGERLPREAEGWLESLVEQSIMAIYCYQDGHFRYVNPKAAEVFGYPAAELMRPGALERIIHPDDWPRMAENIRLRLTGEIPSIRYTLRGIRSDGEVVHLDIHGTRTILEGRPALIGVGYDITERVRAEHEREAAMQARDRFYAMASHELRTPVSTVMLYNDLLLGGMYDPLTPAQREAVEHSQGSARHLLDLINDLLDLSRLEAGRLETRREEVDAALLVESVVAELSPLAREQGSALRLQPPGGPLPLIGDERRIRQILLNLLSNAIKFGEGRPIEVRCEGGDGGGVRIEVADHGAGIAPGDLPRIWEDFVQLGEGAEAGTGLGLPIARRLAELLGGSLEASSTPGAGSTFRLSLPGEPPADL